MQVYIMQTNFLEALFSTPLFGILSSLLAFQIGVLLYKKTRCSAFNPVLVGMILLILFLHSTGTDFESYNLGGAYISFFLGPATVVLAVPLYKKIALLKSSAFPILAGIFAGTFAGISSILLMAKICGLEEFLSLSLVPKSVTTPIGMEVSKQIGGLPAVTVAAIIITGIIGAVLGPAVCRCFKIKDRVALGVAIGTSSHALGTTKAIELGETEGAMSGLAIGLAGLITVGLAPLLVSLFEKLF